MKNSFFKLILIPITCCILIACNEEKELISPFPLKKYSQHLSDWVKPSDTPLIEFSLQQKRLNNLYDHYFGGRSPWNPDYVRKILDHAAPDDLMTNEKNVIAMFDNRNKSKKERGHGENYLPHPINWINDIAKNINLTDIDKASYHPRQRGITIDNLHARVLPTDEVSFYHHKQPGQGYPFDNLQMSALWAGTPVYIISETRDHAWSLVITPDYIAWVKSSGIARASSEFVTRWQIAAKKKLVAITQTKTPVLTQDRFRFQAYVGSFFPATHNKMWVPVVNSKGDAEIQFASPKNVAVMPLPATTKNFSKIMQTLLARPYGWGNLYFYNDCSAELKNLLAPFGFWLPRHSSDQVYAGKIVDLSDESITQRIRYLKDNGHPFFTIVYIGGHILMYLGNFQNPQNKETMIMTYQNMWGLSPKSHNRRSVIGQSALIPLLETFPEDSTLESQADKKYFQVSYLDATPSDLTKLQLIDLKELMYP